MKVKVFFSVAKAIKNKQTWFLRLKFYVYPQSKCYNDHGNYLNANVTDTGRILSQKPCQETLHCL